MVIPWSCYSEEHFNSLKRSADVATQMLPKFAAPAVDSYTGDDDSDGDE